MSKSKQLDAVITQLNESGASIRCKVLADMLSSLGFEVRDGKKTGHKVFVHHGVLRFTSSGYTCGHGKNPEIKPIYTKKVARLLKQYEEELVRYLGEDK